jgi:thioredoxin-related protein
VVLTITSSTKENRIMRIVQSFIVLLSVALVIPMQAAAGSRDDAKINWSSYAEAQKDGNNGRKYFIYFYSEHCGYCKRLESKTFTDTAVVDYINTNYTPVRVNAGTERKLATRFGVQGVPDLRFLSPAGENIARWPGYIESDRLLIMLRYISTDSYKSKHFSDFVKEQEQN